MSRTATTVPKNLTMIKAILSSQPTPFLPRLRDILSKEELASIYMGRGGRHPLKS